MLPRTQVGRLLLAIAFVSSAAICSSCGLGFNTPTALLEDDAAFNVNVVNLSSRTITYQSFYGLKNIAAGASFEEVGKVKTGNNGAGFGHQAKDSKDGSTMTAYCTLRNADQVLLFERTVKFDFDKNECHCEGWGGDDKATCVKN
jgi:hypothetical protein